MKQVALRESWPLSPRACNPEHASFWMTGQCMRPATHVSVDIGLVSVCFSSVDLFYFFLITLTLCSLYPMPSFLIPSANVQPK